jgi:thioredoxin reductase (NADPH)
MEFMMDRKHAKVIIIGSGPAGFTAGLYAGRANLEPIMFEGTQPGGQLTITTEVENFPGFPDGIQGPEMMDLFRKQAHKFGTESVYKEVTGVDFSIRPFELQVEEEIYTADAVIVATGASAKLIEFPNLKKYFGYGISACATCDGFFFKNQDVAVIGGGDSAMEEAIFLTKFARKVTVVHRRDELRASKIMQERALKNPKIDFLWNTVVEDVEGEKRNGHPALTLIKLRDLKTGTLETRQYTGLFFAIGHTPNTQIFAGKLDLDESGYIITMPKSTKTTIEGVFACGDAQDSYYRQAITAAGSGCMAAIDAERWLEAQS